MTKKRRRLRSRQDLEAALREQIQLLQSACNSYDKGFEAVGKHIAITLRVLLHNSATSKALLDQMDYMHIKYIDTAGVIDPENILSECRFVTMRISTSEGGKYLPHVLAHGDEKCNSRISFSRWWNNSVYKDQNGNTMNRRDLILNVADTDGGGHVDQDLDELYYEFSRRNSLGWIFTRGNINEVFKGRPELACMRQIAHEVLLTLKEVTPNLF
jgi:hypothetical protein